MTRVTLHQPAHVDTKRAALLRQIAEVRSGVLPEMMAALATRAAILEGAKLVADDTGVDSALPATEKQIAFLAASLRNRCYYCLDRHAAAALEMGIPADRIRAFYDGDQIAESRLTERERAVTAAAGELTTHARLSPASWASLQRHLDDSECVDLVYVVSAANMFNRIALALEVELEDAVRAVLLGHGIRARSPDRVAGPARQRSERAPAPEEPRA